MHVPILSSLRDRVGELSHTEEPDPVTDLPKSDPRYGCYKVEHTTHDVFEVELIEPENERLRVTPRDDPRTFLFHVDHVDYVSELGEQIRRINEGDYIEVDATRYTKGREYMPFWCIEAVHEVREPRGVERNVLL